MGASLGTSAGNAAGASVTSSLGGSLSSAGGSVGQGMASIGGMKGSVGPEGKATMAKMALGASAGMASVGLATSTEARASLAEGSASSKSGVASIAQGAASLGDAASLEGMRCTMEPVTELKCLEQGDHIAIRDDKGYYHHGIVQSLTEGVIDFGGSDKMDAKLRLIDILKFLDERPMKNLVRITYPEDLSLPVAEVMSRANEFLDNPGSWGAYNLVANNCEHFAVFCKTGRRVSWQVVEKIRELFVSLRGFSR